MLTRTLYLTFTASLAALALAAPVPSGDGEDINFVEVKNVNDDEFKKTNFNVHDETEHDASFNQADASNQDALNAIVFDKDDEGQIYGLVRRQVVVDGSSDVAVTDPLESNDFGLEDEDDNFGASLNFGFDLNTGIDAEFDDSRSIDGLSLLKRGGDGENIKFVRVEKLSNDSFDKTNFNVHDATEHDASFDQVESSNQDTAQAVDFAKDEDEGDKVASSSSHFSPSAESGVPSSSAASTTTATGDY